MGTVHLAVAIVLMCAQDEWKDRVANAKVSIVDAIDLGLKAAGEGTVFHAELEGDADDPVYSIDVAQGGKSRNVVISAVDGDVEDNEVEDEDHSAEVKAAKIGLKQAI